MAALVYSSTIQPQQTGNCNNIQMTETPPFHLILGVLVWHLCGTDIAQLTPAVARIKNLISLHRRCKTMAQPILAMRRDSNESSLTKLTDFLL